MSAASSGVTLETATSTTLLEAAATPRVTFRVRVSGGAGPSPNVGLDFTSVSDSLFVESQEVHCEGASTRGPSPTIEGGERLVALLPACTRYALSPEQCPYRVEQIVLDVAPDGAVHVEPFEVRRRGGGTCEGYGTTIFRVGVGRLVPLRS